MMKLIYIITFLSIINFSYSQDYWEELDLPSNRPVSDVFMDEDGTIYAAGYGVFSTDDLQTWNDINEFSIEIGDNKLAGKISAMPLVSTQVMKFDNSVLVVLNNDGPSFISNNDGQDWNLIELQPDFITSYNDTPILVASSGIYKYDYENSTFNVITNISEDDRLYNADRNGDIVYMKILQGSSRNLLFFDLSTEKFIDSLITDKNELEGDYKEHSQYSYIHRNDTLFVNDNLIRNYEDIDFAAFDLEVISNTDFRQYGFEILANGEIFISSWEGGYILAEPGFKNPQFINSPKVAFNRVSNIKVIDGEYYVCSALGLYRSVNMDLNNLEFISESMGSGLYDYINEENGEFHLIRAGEISTYDGNEKQVKTQLETFTQSWNNNIMYYLKDTLYLSKDFGDSWVSSYIDRPPYRNTILDNGDLLFRGRSEFGIIDNETFEIKYPEIPMINLFDYHVFGSPDNLYLFAQDGLYYSDNYAITWDKLRNFDIDEEVPYYQAEITNLDDVFIVVSRDGIFYSKDKGINWIDLGFGESYEEVSFIKLGNAVYVGAGYIESGLGNTVRLTLNESNDVVFEDMTEGINNMFRGQFFKGTDGKLYVSYRNGNFRTADPVVTSVEEFPESPVQNKLFIYPNVSNSYVNVQSNTMDMELKAYDMNGQQINITFNKESNNAFRADISEFQKGMYVIVDELSGKHNFLIKK